MANTLNREDLLCVVIAAAGNKGLTPVQLQKSIFLLQKSFPKTIGALYNFTPYNYGPFNPEIYTDADKLCSESLVTKRKVNHFSWSKYYILKAGIENTQSIKDNIDADIQSFIEKLISWIQKLKFSELTSFIYTKYPEYKVNSVFFS